MKQLPCGVSDFVRTMRDNLYYVDKTPYLPLLERTGSFLFFVRPRRFGKSLFISMMRAYYDKLRAADFDKLFGKLWIGQHPTGERGRYQVLYLDFSRVGGTSQELQAKVNAYGNIQAAAFVDAYADDYTPEWCAGVKAEPDFGNRLNMICTAAAAKGYSLYLILDEYDNFTNTVLSVEGQAVYRAMTHAYGFYRDLFKKFKGMFERIFMTGVSPVTLNDLTSGYNIGRNISLDETFDKMLGFSTSDVREMLTYYKDAGALPDGTDVEATLHQMEPWYDNYCFSVRALASGDRVFNSNMVLYYMQSLIFNKHAPDNMTDPAVCTDYAKLWQLLRLDQLGGDRHSKLRHIAETGQIVVSELHDMFSADRIVEPEIFPSLLYYNGMVTLTGLRGVRLILGIPNTTVRRQYYDFLLRECQKVAYIDTNDLAMTFDDMALDGQWHDALAAIADAYNKQSSVRDAIEGERNIQGYFLAYLNLNPYYLCAPEVELQHGFCDFFLMPDTRRYRCAHSYILELKYLPRKDYEQKAAAQWAAAVEQIHGYAEGPKVQALAQGTQMHLIVMQFAGWDLARMEEV